MEQLNELLELMRELYNISGFRVSLHDTERQELISYPSAPAAFCSWIQQKPQVRARCEACDAKAFRRVQETKEPYIYHCHYGLYEVVAPLYDFGVLSGYLMMGQMLDTESGSREQVERLASRDAVDLKRLHELVALLPTTTREKLASYVRIMSVCAEYITLTNRMNLGSHSLADEVKRYIGQHYAEKISIDLLARQFLSSKSTLMTAFKQHFDKTINRYLTEVRLREAKKLLHQDLSIGEVAEHCGFADQNYFAKVFFKEYGKTPTGYRNEISGRMRT